MPADLFARRTAPVPPAPAEPDAAFAARPRLIRLRDALARAAKGYRPARWKEPPAFFFDPKRQAELEAARPAPPDPFADPAGRIAAELPALLASADVRRVARAVGLPDAARALAPLCPAAKDLADILAVPDGEVFLALAPADRFGVRLHVRGAADIGQLSALLAPTLPADSFQLFAPAALRPDGTLPAGFAGCAHWLWPTQPLAAVPRIDGERVVLVGPSVVRPAGAAAPRFPALAVECERIESLTAFQTAERLARLGGRPVPVRPPAGAEAVARAA
jgi:hypothetical protein